MPSLREISHINVRKEEDYKRYLRDGGRKLRIEAMLKSKGVRLVVVK
jgi:hypothetical protein